MNIYEANMPDRYVFGTLIVQVLDRITEQPAAKVYAGLAETTAENASRICCGTRVAVTDIDGRFSYRLPAGRWVLALSETNWREVWIPSDQNIEVTVIHNPKDQIRSQ